MASTFHGLTFDAYDAHAVAQFWAAALGRDVAPGATAEHAELPADADAPRLAFDRVRPGGAVGGTARWVSLTDPEGNAFDLIPAA